MYLMIHVLVACLVDYSTSSSVENKIDETSLGSPCSNDTICSTTAGSYCNKQTRICSCGHQTPVRIGERCMASQGIEYTCLYDEECSYSDKNSHCRQVGEEESVCKCKAGFEKFILENVRAICIQTLGNGTSETVVPAVTSLMVGLVILTALLIFMGKLFTKDRWSRSRGYADAGIPPTIVIDGKDVNENSEEKIFGAGEPLSRDQLRKMSIMSSVTLPVNKDLTIKALSPSNSQEYQEFFGQDGEGQGDYAQHITIVSSRGKRRGSMVDTAFPELHAKSKGKKNPNLMILTRTKTDNLGRRHSVAVPLIPPEGYDIQSDFLSQNNTPKNSGRMNNRRRSSVRATQNEEKLHVPKSSRLNTRRSSTQGFLHFLDLAVAN